MRERASILVAVAVLVAGCIGATDGADDQLGAQNTDVPATPLPIDPVNTDLIDAAGTVSTLVDFVKTHSHRNYDGPQHKSARDFLAGELDSLGYEVVRQGFMDPTSAAGFEGVGPEVYLENIVGIKWGATHPDDWIVVGGHYDTVAAAVEGAYDDGSGTIMTIGLARALQDVELDRTVAFVLFDGEERGLRGSRYFADSVTDFYDNVDSEPFEYQPNITAMVDLDMIGINYPAEPPIVFDQNSPQIETFVGELAGELGIPEDKLLYRGISAGRSDYASFEDAGIPVAFFISNFDDVWYENYQVPRTYPFWHQMDTVETMETMAGGRDMLVAGFDTAMRLSGGLTVYLASDGDLQLDVVQEEA